MSLYDVPLDDIGICSNGYMMGDYATVVSVALATALSPEIQRAYREKRLKDFRHIFYFCQMTALMFVFLVSCWMPEIYKLIVRNPDLQIAVPIASLICYANVVNPFYNFLATVVFITKETKYLLWLVFLPGVLNVTLCLIFVPIFGYMAAVYSTLISFWSLLLIPFISRFHAKNVSEWLGTRWKIFAVFIILLASLTFGNIMKDQLTVLKIVITLIIGTAYLCLLKYKKSLRTF